MPCGGSGGRANEGSNRAAGAGRRDHPGHAGGVAAPAGRRPPPRRRPGGTWSGPGRRPTTPACGPRRSRRAPGSCATSAGQHDGGRARRRPRGPAWPPTGGPSASPAAGMRKLAAEVGAPNLDAPGLRGATRLKAKAPAATTAAGINPDPAWDYKGLLWDYRRIGLPQGWKTTAGSSKVTVGVADTGLDFTHSELASKVKAGGRLHRPRGPAHLQDLLRRLRRGPGGRVRRAGDHRLERPRLLDRRPHRRRPQRHRHQRDRPQGQPGRPQDLPVVRLGQRRRRSWPRS